MYALCCLVNDHFCSCTFIFTFTGSSIRLLVTVARYIINDDTSPDTSLFTNNHLKMLLCSYTATLSINGNNVPYSLFMMIILLDMAILYLILCYEKAGISLSGQM